MPESATPAYTLTARILHWVTAALVLTMIPIGVAMANADFGAWQDTLYHLHRSIGAVLLPLVLVPADLAPRPIRRRRCRRISRRSSNSPRMPRIGRCMDC